MLNAIELRDVLHGLILFNILLILTLVFSLFVNKFRNSRKQRRLERITDLQDNLIFQYLSEQDKRTVIPDRLRAHHLLNRKYRNNFVKLLLRYQKNFSGEYTLVLRQLYLKLQLDQHSLKKLKSNRWNLCIEGIRELAQMEVVEATIRISKFLEVKNRFLKMEAVVALVELTKIDALHFIDKHNYVLSEWEQILILDKFLALSKTDVPQFSSWLDSKNHSLVSFALYLVKFFNQYEAEEAVIRCLYHPSENVRKLSIQVIGDMLFTESRKKLLSIYFHQPLHLQTEILNTLGKIGSRKDIVFLKEQLVYNMYEHLLAAVRAIVNIDPDAVKELDVLVNLNEQLPALIAHALDKRI